VDTLADALSKIITKSTNPTFQKRCANLLKGESFSSLEEQLASMIRRKCKSSAKLVETKRASRSKTSSSSTSSSSSLHTSSSSSSSSSSDSSSVAAQVTDIKENPNARSEHCQELDNVPSDHSMEPRDPAPSTASTGPPLSSTDSMHQRRENEPKPDLADHSSKVPEASNETLAPPRERQLPKINLQQLLQSKSFRF
jgi:hypothetical protein